MPAILVCGCGRYTSGRHPPEAFALTLSLPRVMFRLFPCRTDLLEYAGYLRGRIGPASAVACRLHRGDCGSTAGCADHGQEAFHPAPAASAAGADRTAPDRPAEGAAAAHARSRAAHR